MSEVRNVPRLRFPGFQGEWERHLLNELFFEHKERNVESEFTKNQVLSVSGENGIVNQIEHLGRSYAGVSISNYHVVRENDVVYTKSPLKANPYGIVKVNFGKPGVVSTLYAVYRSKNTIHPFFIHLYFSLNENVNRYFRPLVRRGAKNDMKINNDVVLSGPIFTPTLSEQRKISDFFNFLIKQIIQFQRKKALLEKYKKGMMQKIFNQEIRFKDEDGKDFGDWEEKKLGDVATFSKGKGVSKAEIDINGNIECIRYGQLYTQYKETISDVISRTNVPIENLVLSKANDVIIPASGETQIDIATASCVLRSGIALGGDLNIIRSVNNGVFLSYYLNSVKKQEIANLSQGISVVHLYAGQLATLALKLPNIEEQTKIANFLSSIDNKINLVAIQIEKMENWKKGLLGEMFV